MGLLLLVEDDESIGSVLESSLRAHGHRADVWDPGWVGSTQPLDVHVAALRRRLAEHSEADSVPRIVTVRGYGYRLETPST
jgi:DNA-binding response OmpR family regulator